VIALVMGGDTKRRKSTVIRLRYRATFSGGQTPSGKSPPLLVGGRGATKTGDPVSTHGAWPKGFVDQCGAAHFVTTRFEAYGTETCIPPRRRACKSGCAAMNSARWQKWSGEGDWGEMYEQDVLGHYENMGGCPAVRGVVPMAAGPFPPIIFYIGRSKARAKSFANMTRRIAKQGLLLFAAGYVLPARHGSFRYSAAGMTRCPGVIRGRHEQHHQTRLVHRTIPARR